ncbi:hypothetical protein E4U41_007189 [Claviceps citrina]|nr:hypothetical protein E4U41_007189 [Claviceps citrina]
MMLLLKDAARGSRAGGAALLRRATRRFSPWRSSIIPLVTLLSLYVFRFPLLEWCDHVRQTQPWLGQAQLEQMFTPTESELACLHGGNSSSSSSRSRSRSRSSDARNALTSTSSPPPPPPQQQKQADPIPNVVHFIYIFQEPLALRRGLQFGFVEYLAVRSALVSLQPSAVVLHYAFVHKNGDASSKMRMDPMSNPWVRRLRDRMLLVEHQLGDVRGRSASHLADVMSLELLRDNGGLFLDLRTFALRPFTAIMDPPAGQDVVLGYEGGNRWGLGNAAIAARKNSTLLHRWLAEYATGRRGRRPDKSRRRLFFPARLADRAPPGVCALPPDAFFWPTWTSRHVEWMHEELDAEQARHWTEEIGKNGGALFAGQLAYHAWDHGGAGRHLTGLTPETVRRRNTRFNLLMRRFIENDIY